MLLILLYAKQCLSAWKIVLFLVSQASLIKQHPFYWEFKQFYKLVCEKYPDEPLATALLENNVDAIF